MKDISYRILLCILFFLLSSTAFGAVVYLNSGESLSGRIKSMDEQTLSLESDRGFGILRIERADIRLIEFDNTGNNLARKLGLGFYQPGIALNGRGNSREYNTGKFSFKHWFTAEDAFEVLVGYSETIEGKDALFKIVNLEGRLSQVFLQEGQQHLYWGGGFGLLMVTDEQEKVDDSGIGLQVFLGIEMFSLSLPNVGLSVEGGMKRQSVGDRNSQFFFNAVAARYYF